MRVLVTGAAGFIGYHTASRLIDRGHEVIGLDNLNSYYDVSLKEARVARLKERERFRFIKADLGDRTMIEATFAEEKPSRVIHLAAQAGVRYSLEQPHAYVNSNVTGFLHVLEGCRHHEVEHLVYASSSSVYGGNRALPFSVSDNVDHPVSLYGATKKANELMAHSYAHLFRLPVTGLRFFTVYGPWGRPDMSLFIFTRKILAGEPIPVFNYGHHARDFTYIDDAVEGVLRTLDTIASPIGALRRRTRRPPRRLTASTISAITARSPCSTISPRSRGPLAWRPRSSSCQRNPETWRRLMPTWKR
jgi:UDP-glucuronate 4-epimerase